MKMELRKWSLTDYKELKDLCNAVDRSYLSDRLPNPYTEDDANWWLNMVAKSEGIDGTFRAMVVDGKAHFTKEWFYTRRSHAQSGD